MEKIESIDGFLSYCKEKRNLKLLGLYNKLKNPTTPRIDKLLIISSIILSLRKKGVQVNTNFVNQLLEFV